MKEVSIMFNTFLFEFFMVVVIVMLDVDIQIVTAGNYLSFQNSYRRQQSSRATSTSTAEKLYQFPDSIVRQMKSKTMQ